MSFNVKIAEIFHQALHVVGNYIFSATEFVFYSESRMADLSGMEWNTTDCRPLDGRRLRQRPDRLVYRIVT